MRHQSEPVRDFLLQSAVLDRFTGSLCDAVTGRSDGNDVLVALERANLFLVPLDDRREWYRYHHLFADVLRSRMLAEQPEGVLRLHQRASQWFERHDLAEEAVRHALAAQDFDRAAHLMELAAPAIRRDRREATLLGWLGALPDHAVRRSPVLSAFYGYMLMLSGDLDAAELRIDEAERALAAAPADPAARPADTEELRTLPLTVAVYRASLAQARGDVAGTLEHARRALELAGPADHLARGGAAGFLALAAWVQGDVASALTTFTQAVASLHAAGALVDELSSTVLLADMWRAAGRPSRAIRLCRLALQTAEAHGDLMARAAADLHTEISEITCDAADFASAKGHLERAAALGERASMAESGYRWFVAMARVADGRGEFGEAITLLDRAEQLYRPAFFPDVRPIAAMKARTWIRQGNLSPALAWAHEREVSATGDASYLREFDHLTLVRLLIAQHRATPGTSVLDQAAALLDRLRGPAESSGRGGSLIEIQMLRALVLDAQAHRAQALESLAAALEQAPEPEGYVRLFLDEGPPMVELLRDAALQGLAGGHPRRLLSLGADTSGSQQRPETSSPESLSDRELQVLRLLDGELSGPQIAQKLFVSQNTLRSHTKHIFTKLGVTSRRAAVRRARELGLI